MTFSLQQLSQSTTPILSLAEAYAHLRIDDNASDTYLSSITERATQLIEAETNVDLRPTTWLWKGHFPRVNRTMPFYSPHYRHEMADYWLFHHNKIRLPRGPLTPTYTATVTNAILTNLLDVSATCTGSDGLTFAATNGLYLHYSSNTWILTYSDGTEWTMADTGSGWAGTYTPLTGSMAYPNITATSNPLIQYYDTTNTLQTWATTNYCVMAGRKTLPEINCSTYYPGCYPYRPDQVWITYQSGWQTAPELAKHAALLLMGGWFDNREDPTESNVKTLPTGFDRLLDTFAIVPQA